MGFLRRLRGADDEPADGRPPVTPFIDDCQGDPAARDWVEELRRGEWRGFAGHLVEEPDPVRRDFEIKVVGVTFPGELDWIDTWIEEEPESATAGLVRGATEIDWAWAIRTGARASKVSAEQAADFITLLEAAKDDLLLAAGLAPDDGGPWSFLTAVALGLNAERDDAEEILAKVQERSPWHPWAYRTMTQYHTAKWHGSNEAVLAFARAVLAGAPAGLPVHAVVPEAFLEVASEAGERALRAGRDEILAAAERSIDHPDRVDSPWWIRARSSFAVAYHRLGEKDRLRAELEVIGPSVTGSWQMYFRDPVGEFRRARRSVGLG
jgi:hypothetical protein